MYTKGCKEVVEDDVSSFYVKQDKCSCNTFIDHEEIFKVSSTRVLGLLIDDGLLRRTGCFCLQ